MNKDFLEELKNTGAIIRKKNTKPAESKQAKTAPAGKSKKTAGHSLKKRAQSIKTAFENGDDIILTFRITNKHERQIILKVAEYLENKDYRTFQQGFFELLEKALNDNLS